MYLNHLIYALSHLFDFEKASYKKLVVEKRFG